MLLKDITKASLDLCRLTQWYLHLSCAVAACRLYRSHLCCEPCALFLKPLQTSFCKSLHTLHSMTQQITTQHSTTQQRTAQLIKAWVVLCRQPQGCCADPPHTGHSSGVPPRLCGPGKHQNGSQRQLPVFPDPGPHLRQSGGGVHSKCGWPHRVLAGGWPGALLKSTQALSESLARQQVLHPLGLCKSDCMSTGPSPSRALSESLHRQQVPHPIKLCPSHCTVNSSLIPSGFVRVTRTSPQALRLCQSHMHVNRLMDLRSCSSV